MKIKSWVGQKVRIKREYLEYTADWDVEVYLSSEVPFKNFFGQCRCDDHHSGNPESWVGYVHINFYGVDLMRSKNGFEMSEYPPSSQLVFRTLGDDDSCIYAWDAKYFEVVKEVKVERTEYKVDEQYK